MPFPITDTVYRMFTSDNEIKKFRAAPAPYIEALGVAVGSRAHQILTQVPWGGALPLAVAQELAGLIVAEIKSRDEGPLSVQYSLNLPLLRGIHAKFVQSIDVDWGPYTDLAVALGEELYAQKVIW